MKKGKEREEERGKGRTIRYESYDTIEEFNVDSKAEYTAYNLAHVARNYKKVVLPQGNRAMLQVFFSVEVRQQHSLQV